MKSKFIMCDRTRRPWTHEEDTLLADIVSHSDQIVWTRIAEKFEFRSGKQCRERWINHLNPKKVEIEWSQREDELLFHLHNILGNRWAQIANKLQRSEYSVKNRWNRIASGKTKKSYGLHRSNPLYKNKNEGEDYCSVPIIPVGPIGVGSFNLNISPAPISLMEQQFSVPITSFCPSNKLPDQSMMKPDFDYPSKVSVSPQIDMSISSLLNH